MYNSFTAGTNSDPDKYNNETATKSHKSSKNSWRENMLYLTYVTNTGGSLDCVQLLGTNSDFRGTIK